ncbi:hypothetical protein B0H13DRAFT_2014908 [Mycena leptocephala]|nr:hypothetical protein B0H13DRAFT_2014908 [Mycena leptocephala]
MPRPLSPSRSSSLLVCWRRGSESVPLKNSSALTTSHPYLLLAPASPPSAHAAKRHRSRRTRRARCTKRGRRVGRLGARMLLVLALLQQGVWKKRVGLARRHERMRNRMRSRLARRCEGGWGMKRRARKTPGRGPKEGQHRQVARVAFSFVRDLPLQLLVPATPNRPSERRTRRRFHKPHIRLSLSTHHPTPNPPSPPQKCAPSVACSPRSATRRRRRTDRLPKSPHRRTPHRTPPLVSPHH